MNIVDVADLLPGACYVTGRSDGPFVDTGYDVDDRPNVGRVYLAASFISDCQALLGGLGPEAAQQLRDGIAARDERIAQLEQAVEGLTAANEALFRGGYQPDPILPVDETAVIEPEPDPVTAEEVLASIRAALEELDDDELLERALSVGATPVDGAADARAALIDAIVERVSVPQ